MLDPKEYPCIFDDTDYVPNYIPPKIPDEIRERIRKKALEKVKAEKTDK